MIQSLPDERFADAVRSWAERDPSRVCLTFWDHGVVADEVTYTTLWKEAAAWAQLFREHELGPGDPVVLLARSVRGFVSALIGAQCAGLLAVPCPPPSALEADGRSLRRVAAFMTLCKARVLVDPAHPERAGEPAPVPGNGRTMLTARMLRPDQKDDLDYWTIRQPFAYCQFTSGSGGRSKGVLLTHRNVLAHVRAAEESFGLRDDVWVSWLPLYHDMGLVGFVLRPLLLGQPVHLMQATEFVRTPVSWLRLITRVRGTISTAPNFAYGVCARRISSEEMNGLDLSSWRMALNGSEPVVRDDVEAFIRRFEPVGFRPGTMLPAYGLAENTLTATSRRPGEGARFDEVSRLGLERDRIARRREASEPYYVIASVGRPLVGQEVAIFSDEPGYLPERRVGEIAIRGETVMSGYSLGSSPRSALRDDGWLLTGDLGYLADGELFVVGRKDDLIIRAGQNYYPHDLEVVASRVPGVRLGRAVAFAASDPEREHIVVAVERDERWNGTIEELRAAVAHAVFSAVRFTPDAIIVLPARSIPLTTSGKLIRPEARRLYQDTWRADA